MGGNGNKHVRHVKFCSSDREEKRGVEGGGVHIQTGQSTG